MRRPQGWGVGIPPETLPGTWAGQAVLDLLQPAWFYNWQPDPVGERAGSVFVPMVWDGTLDTRHASRLEDHPGETWLFMNEPERPEQANTDPATAADLTRDFLRMAWDEGGEFQWCAPGVAVNMDDHDGLAWATEYVQDIRRRGISRPSYWHVHCYRSTTAAQFWQGWGNWRLWYEVWGVGAPVVISEVCAEAASYANQTAVMLAVDSLLQSGEVTAAAWFSSHKSDVSQWPQSTLTTIDAVAQTVALTPLGQHFVGLALYPPA